MARREHAIGSKARRDIEENTVDKLLIIGDELARDVEVRRLETHQLVRQRDSRQTKRRPLPSKNAVSSFT